MPSLSKSKFNRISGVRLRSSHHVAERLRHVRAALDRHGCSSRAWLCAPLGHALLGQMGLATPPQRLFAIALLIVCVLAHVPMSTLC